MPKTIVLLCLAALLSACGQTGPLYLPDQGKPKRHAKAVPVKVVAPDEKDKAPAAAGDSNAPAAEPAAPTADVPATEPAPADSNTPPAATPAQ